MGTKKGKLFAKMILTVAVILMSVQILTGMIWMFKNITAIPAFGDSGEYLNLSQTLELDEYRPVMYPLILRFVCSATPLLGIPYQTCMYILQTLVCFVSLYYGLSVIDHVLSGDPVFSGNRLRQGAVVSQELNSLSARNRGTHRCVRTFLALYLMTIPMITFMNFCILTDSLAVSMLVVFLSSLIIMCSREQVSPGNYVLMALSLIVESLLRADRLYSCLLLAVIAFLVKILRMREEKRERRRAIAAMLCVCLSVVAIVRGVSAVTQTPGLNGRVRTNLEFVLLDRIVWPNMTANYESFPQDIRDVITLEDAKTFDKHNNNVMYYLAPMLEEKCGQEKARTMYCTMARIVFENQTKKVLFDIGEDIAAMFFTPLSSLLNTKRLCSKGDSWNVHCMSSVTPNLTRRYNAWYQYTFLILAVMGMVCAVFSVFDRKRKGLQRLFRTLLPYFGMSVILTLWFSLGDGAPPNDRYALIIYLFWSLMSIGLLGFWEI